MRARRRFVCSVVATGVALAGCGRDFAVPTTPPAPHVTGFSPASAYAGQLVRIEGSGFAPKAADDRVAFAGGTTTAESVTGAGALLVRVPADVFDGPLSVTTAAGTAVSTTDFHYLGYGTLRRGVVQGSLQVHHAPAAMAVVGGKPVIWSTLFEDLVDTQGRWFATRTASPPIFATVAGTTYLGFQWQSPVLVLDPVRRRATIGFDLGSSMELMALAADPSTGRLAILEASAGTGPQTTGFLTFDPATGNLSAARSSAIGSVRTMAAFGDGRLFLWGDDGSGCQLFVLDPTGASVTTTCLESRFQKPDPVAVTALEVGGRATAVAAFADGSLAILDVDGTAPASWVDALGSDRVDSLAVASTTSGPRIVGVRPDAPSALSVDPATATLEWEKPLGIAPRVLAADGARLYVADAADDRISELDVPTAMPLGQADVEVSFAAEADRRRVAALATIDDKPAVLVPDTVDHALLAIDPADPAGSAATIDLPDVQPTGVAVGPDQTIWVLGQDWAGFLDVVATPQGVAYRPTGSQVLGAPVDIAPTPDGDAYVADAAGVVTCDSSGACPRLVDASTGWVRRLFLRPDGTLDVVFELDSGEAHVERIDPGDPTTPLAAADAHPAGTDSLYDAVLVDGRLMLLFSGFDADGLVPLDPDTLAKDAAVGGWSLNDLQVIAVSPNGRDTLADIGGTLDPGTGRITGNLGVLGIRPGRPVAPRALMSVPGSPAGAAFGPRGERAYVPLISTDEIVILE